MTASHGYRRVCIVPGEWHHVYGSDGKQVGFINRAGGYAYGWNWRLWGGDWVCEGASLNEAYAQVVQAHGDLVATPRERTEGAG